MSSESCAARIRFVLCEPGHPGNIGSAARAIKTMGFRDLRVVNPRESDYRTHEEALAYATSSADVLAASRSHATLAEALEGVTYAWALTGYEREFGAPLTPLRQATHASLDWLNQEPGDIAFVFGTERSGLTNEEVMACQGCIAIACDPESPSLNLAQAVQITAYEMHQTMLEESGRSLYDWQRRFEQEPPASVEAIEGFYQHWEQAMIACGVHDPANPKFLMPMTRKLFTRSGLTQTEVDLLRGICSAIIRPKAQRAGSKKKAAPAPTEQEKNLHKSDDFCHNP